MFGLGCFAVNAEAQVFRMEPSILVSEEYNDNVFLHRNDTAEAYITRVAPSIRVRYATSFWEWDINYTYNYYYYYYSSTTSRQVQPDHDQTHALSARNRTEIIKDSLFFEARDDYSRVSQNIAVDYTQQSPSANQVDQNVFAVNPYLVLRPWASARLTLGYIYQDTRYLNAAAATSIENINRIENIGYGEAAVNLSSRLTVSTGARYTQDRNTALSFNQIDVFAGPQYAYAENGAVFAKFGKSWFEFEHDRLPRKEYWFWDGGLNHRISTITFTLVARRSVAQDPQRAVTLMDQYTASITKTAPRYVLTLGGGWYEYRDAVIDQRISTSEQVQSTFLYRFTPSTSGTLGAAFQDVHDVSLGGNSKIALGNIRFDHQLSPKDTLSLEYRFANSHSYDIATNNYSNNRGIVEYRHAF
jgi:hypothetical protein